MNKDLIEKHRDINVECRLWHENIYDDFRAEHPLLGIDRNSMAFSGFWDQGDGASFSGHILEHNILQVMDAAGIPRDRYPTLMRLLDNDGGVTITYMRSHGSTYVHSRTVRVEAQLTGWSFNDALCESASELEQVVADKLDEVAEIEADDLASDVLDYLRDKMDELYYQLEKEYEYLTSDEMVWETIVACELDKEVRYDVEADRYTITSELGGERVVERRLGKYEYELSAEGT